MSRKIILLFIIVVVIVGWNVGNFRQYLQNRLIPPIELVGAPYLHAGDGAASTVFHPGQAVFVHTHTRRVAECTVTISYSLLEISIDTNGVHHRTFWYSFRIIMTSTGIGVFDTDERRIIPDWIPPGDYFFSRYAIYQCGGITIEHKTPAMAVKLVLPVLPDRGMQ